MDSLDGLSLFRRGKVRDTWRAGDDLLMVATDRISAFDVVLPTPIPGKGIVLTRTAAWWFEQLGDLVPTHLITANLGDMAGLVPDSVVADPYLEGRSMLVRPAERVDVECVVRGYLYGSVWNDYQATGSVAGHRLPAGLRLADRLPEPIFTPAMKVDDGHDVNATVDEVASRYGEGLTEQLARMSLEIYDFACERLRDSGLLLADTKFEFGFIDGKLSVIDEILTPDSSRYWDAAEYQPGRDQPSFDKQFLRDWLTSSGWKQQPPGPALPKPVVDETLGRYLEAYRRVTGQELDLSSYPSARSA